MKFNMNNYIRVQLTDEGRRIHRANHAALLSALPVESAAAFPYQPPVEDADGWSRWQGWHLMREFGAWLSITREPPFNLTVEIETTD